MLLIKNALLYDPACRGKKDILISFDKILQIDDRIEGSFPDLEVLDADGRIAIPGLIDQHVHSTGGGGEQGFQSRTPEIRLSDIVTSGVTTMVGVLGTDSITRTVENLVAKTKALTNEGITAYCLTGAYCYPPVTVTGSVGNDIAMISEILGCKLAISDHRGSHPTREEIIRLVSEIRTAALISGKPGVLHMHVGIDPAGIEPIMDIVRTTDIPVWHFRPTHLDRIPEQAAMFTQMGGYADFTASESLAEILCSVWDRLSLPLVTISSDANGSMPKWDESHEHVIGMGVGKMTTLISAVRDLVKKGIPLETVLPFLTENVAKALLLYPKKGTLRKGSDADLVLLDRDLAIDTVIAGGTRMMDAGEVLVKGMYE